MSDDATPRLDLPYLAAAQAQKHVTVNAALAALDGLVGCAVQSRAVAAEPATPADGQCWLLPVAASGPDWSLHGAGTLLRFEAGAWTVLAAPPGTVALVVDERRLLVREVAGWTALGDLVGEVVGLSQLGVGATPTATDPLAVAGAGALFTHVGADMRVTVNKASAASTASLLLQDGYSGRAEVGLGGDDDLHVKVSADGASWRDAMVVHGADASVSLPGAGLSVRTPSTGIEVDEPGGAWAARLLNQTNLDGQNGAVVANMWYSASTWTFMVGCANHLVGSPAFKPFFAVRGDGLSVFSAPAQFASFTKAQLPSAGYFGAGSVVFVPDESGGPTLAFSDGSGWRRVQDRASVS